MGNWFADPENAQLLRRLIWERIQRDKDCPGITHGQDPYGEYYHFLAGDRVFVQVRAYVRPSGGLDICYLMMLDGPDVAAACITISDERICFEIREEKAYRRTVAQARVRLEHGLIPYKLHMPYGYVQDGIVIAIWYARQAPGYVPGSIATGVEDFVLQGHEMPKALLSRNGDPLEYMTNYWDLMRAGEIIELSDRVVCHPGALWFLTSNTPWPQLVFSLDDGQLPRLPANVPYLLQLATDPADSDLPRTRALVEKYQQNDEGPVDMSEFFAQFRDT